MRNLLCATCASVLAMLAPATPAAAADVIAQYKCVADNVMCPGGNVGLSLSGGTLDLGAVIGSTSSGPHDSAAAKLRADFGLLGGSATASSSLASGVTSASFRANWDDEFTVVNNGAGQGSVAIVRFTSIIDIADLSAFANADEYTRATIGILYTLVDTQRFFRLDIGSGASEPPLNDLRIGRNIVTTDIPFYVGVVGSAGSRLEGYVNLINGQYAGPAATGSSGGTVNALHTARTYAQVLTPGFTLRTGSGHNYAQLAVPEPATWMAMILGFGVIGLGMRRARKTSGPRPLPVFA